MRQSSIEYSEGNTKISIELNLDGTGISNIKTGNGFLDHMLTAFSKHGHFDLNLSCQAKIFDKSVPVIGNVLGQAIRKALLTEDISLLGKAQNVIPMDEALISCVIGGGAAGKCAFKIKIPTKQCGAFNTNLVKPFFQELAKSSQMSLTFAMFFGENSHHILEGAFKAFAKTLEEAIIPMAQIDKLNKVMSPETPRIAKVSRATKETDIKCTLILDGTGKASINSGSKILDNLLIEFTKHANFDLILTCNGDVDVDLHHTTEDIGIVLGTAILKALGDLKGINRYAYKVYNNNQGDIVLSVVDICGRDTLNYKVKIDVERVGDFDTELIKEFLLGLTRNSKIALHMKSYLVNNDYNLMLCTFASLGETLGKAVRLNPDFSDETVSTKGTL